MFIRHKQMSRQHEMTSAPLTARHSLIADEVNDGNNEKDEGIMWSDATRQIFASCCEYCIVIQVGINLSYSAVLLPQLTGSDSKIQITKEQASWIASLMTLFLPVGSLCTGPLIDRFGRKKVTIALCPPLILVWLVFAFATSVYHLYLARILSGVIAGITTVSLVYVSEITHVSFRSMLLSLNSVFVSFGILITCVFSLFFNWQQLSYVYCITVLCTFLLLFLIPESPHWLHVFKEDSYEDVVKSLRWLYTRPEIFSSQYQEIMKNTNTMFSTQRSNENWKRKFADHMKLYREPAVYRPVFVLFLLFLFQQFSGAYLIIFYAVDIFCQLNTSSRGGIDEYVALVILGTIRLVMAIVSTFLSKRVGRKPLLYVSGLGMSLSCLIVSLCPWLFHQRLSNWISIIFVLIYVCMGSMGVLVIPWTLIAELLPIKVKGNLGGVLITFAYLDMFLVVKTFPNLLGFLTIQVVFAFFAVVSLLMVCFVYMFLPETFGKSFQEIEAHFFKTEQPE